MVDTGIVVSLVTRKMAREIEKTDGNTWWNHRANRTQLRKYNNSPIQNLGLLYCEVESNGWNGGRVALIVVPNNHRALIGRDVIESLVLRFSQVIPTKVTVSNLFQAIPIVVHTKHQSLNDSTD